MYEGIPVFKAEHKYDLKNNQELFKMQDVQMLILKANQYLCVEAYTKNAIKSDN